MDGRETRRALLLQGLGLLAVLLLAAGLRLYQLDTIPAGLHYDEASQGDLALSILGGQRPVFFSAYTGQEAGFHYLQALAIRLLGQTTLALRLPAALAGVALVGAIFLLARRVVGAHGALLAAAAAAGASWLLHINRIGLRANLLPLTMALWAWLLLQGLDQNRRRDWLWGGLWLGLTAYTYLAARFVPILVVAFLAYLALAHRPLLRDRWRGLALMLVVGALVATPLAVHYLRVPGDWGERLRQINACSGATSAACARTLGQHLWDALLMVGVRGDPLPFFNLPGSPALPRGLALPFYLGLALALWRWRDHRRALLVLWWLAMVLPGALSVESPHSLRTIGAAPPAMILWALPFVELRALVRSRPRLAAGPLLAGWAFALLIAWSSAGEYFGRWASRPEIYYDYMQYAVDASRALAATPPDVDIFISEQFYRHASYRFLVPRMEQARWFDARSAWPLAQPGRRTIYIIPPSAPAAPGVTPLIAGANGTNHASDQGLYAYTRLELPAGQITTPQPPVAVSATIGQLEIEGLAPGAAAPGQPLEVQLFCRAGGPETRELRLFLHLVDPQGRAIAQHDSLGYPAQEWRAGDRFVSLHALPLPPDLPPGRYELVFGLYDALTLERLPVAGAPATFELRHALDIVPGS